MREQFREGGSLPRGKSRVPLKVTIQSAGKSLERSEKEEAFGLHFFFTLDFFIVFLRQLCRQEEKQKRGGGEPSPPPPERLRGFPSRGAASFPLLLRTSETKRDSL
jgi:hypothetical protein